MVLNEDNDNEDKLLLIAIVIIVYQVYSLVGEME